MLGPLTGTNMTDKVTEQDARPARADEETWRIVGVTPMDAQNKKFDPNFHQAVDTVKIAEGEDQTIVEEYQRGYEFKGRLLRPAMVKVAVRE